jgi:hypothetical protein
MLYISGPNDTLLDLHVQEGFEGSFADYQKKFAELNPELVKKIPKDTHKLPMYMPMQLVTMPGQDFKHSSEAARIISTYSLQERQVLRVMQEENHDIPTSVTTTNLLEDFQMYLGGIKKQLGAPLIVTPIYELNRSLTEKSLIKMSGESLKHAAFLKETSTSYFNKNKLFELMKKRDELNHEWLKLRGQKGAGSAAARRALERQTKDLTAQIKKLIPKQIATSGEKYIHGLKADEAAKLRHGASSLKLAKKGAAKIKATHLDRLTVTGLAKQRSLIKGFKVLGDGVKKFATYTNYALAAYAIEETYVQGGNVAKTAFREGTSLYAGTLLSAAAGGGLATLGGIAIGTLAGDATLGAAILVCYPVIGWVVLVVAGATVAGFVSYQTKEVSERVWDAFESGYVKEKIFELGRWIYDDFKFLGEQIARSD